MRKSLLGPAGKKTDDHRPEGDFGAGTRDDEPADHPDDAAAADLAEGSAASAGTATDEPVEDSASAEAADGDGEGSDGEAAARPGLFAQAAAFLRRSVLPKTRRARALAVLVLVAVVGGTAGGFVWWRASQLPSDAAFELGGRVVTVDALNHEIDTLRALYGVQPPHDVTQLAAFRKDAAKSYAVARTLDRAAADNQIAIADKTARDVLTRYIAQQLGDGSDAHGQFVQALGNAGTNESAVLDEIKRQLAIGQLFDKVTHGIGVSDQEVRDAFPQRQTQLATPEKRHIFNIVVQNQTDADQVAQQLNGGADFATLARQVSLDGSSRNSGGDLGEIAQSQLDDNYGKAAFAVADGGIFGPAQTQYGWNVGKVSGIVPGVPAQFEQVKDRLKQQLTAEKSLATWRDWLGQQIRDAHVRYADDYRPADPDAPPQLQPGSVPTPGQPGAGPQQAPAPPSSSGAPR